MLPQLDFFFIFELTPRLQQELLETSLYFNNPAVFRTSIDSNKADKQFISECSKYSPFKDFCQLTL